MKTWEEMRKDKSGTIYKDWFEDGIRCLIMRGPASLCAYLGVPETHPLADKSYDDIPLSVHGGLTFSCKGDGMRPTGYYWYGWDYAHCNDYAFYYDEPPLANGFDHSPDKKWTVDEVEKEIKSAVYDFKMLVKLAENIKGG